MNYKISEALAWQSYEKIDLLFVLNRKNKNFYFFQNTARVILDGILQKKSTEQICEQCLETYNTSPEAMRDEINEFMLLLLQEEILNEISE